MTAPTFSPNGTRARVEAKADLLSLRAEMESALDAYLQAGLRVAELRRRIARQEARLAALPP